MIKRLNPQIDKYLIDGCMRCKYGATPQCKVNNWRTELELLRQLALDCSLTEELKWGVPCYTYNKKNVVMVSALKSYACLSFFKGSLLTDPKKILQKPGDNSQASRIIGFNSPEKILLLEETLKTYIREAIEIEKSGEKVQFKKRPEPLPQELIDKFSESQELEKAFFALTPGRQRGYILYFSQPKRSESRINRIEKCIPAIFNGRGLHDKYSK